MERQVKIILVSGISITINEDDKVDINDFKMDLTDICKFVMGESKDIVIKHRISTGEYMEYYLTRDKITWCYYSEVPKKDEEV